MKLLKKHNYLIYQIHLPLVFVFLLLIIFAPKQITLALSGYWLLVPLLIYTIVSRKTSLRIQKENLAIKKFKPWIVFGSTWLVQLCVVGLIIGAYQLTLNALPIIAMPTLNFADTSKTLFFAWGLFPFPIYILLSIVMAKVSFIDNQRGMLSVATHSIFRNTIEDDIGVTMDSFMRVSISIFFSILLALGALVIMQLIQVHYQLNIINQPSVPTLITGTIIFLLVNGLQWHQGIRTVSHSKLPSNIIAIGFILLLSVVLLAGIYIVRNAISFQPELIQPIKLPAIPNLGYYWYIFMAMLLLIFTPIYAGMMAYLWRGYRLRSMALTNCLLPTLIFIGLFFLPSRIQLGQAGLYTGAVAIILLLILLFRHRFTAAYLRATVPDSQYLKPRPRQHLLQQLSLNMSLFTVLYLVIGSVSMAAVLFIAAGPPVLSILFGIFKLIRD